MGRLTRRAGAETGRPCVPERVFAGLLEAVNLQLAEPSRLDVDPADGLVSRAADTLAAAMIDADSEALPSTTAKAICETLYPERRRSKSLFEGLITEGVLLRELTTTIGGHDAPAPVDQIRFTYQRLADYLRAEALLARHPADEDLRQSVLALAQGGRTWARAGLIEALVLVVPERRGVELADLLGLRPGRPRRPPVRPGRRRSPGEVERALLRDQLGRAFFDTLPWRAPESITPPTLNLLQAYLNAGVIHPKDWLVLLLTLACVPDHPLNVRRLDQALLRAMSMPERDARWSDDVLGIWSEDTNPVTRTMDWAWSPNTTPPDDVAEIAATLLTWLFTNTNRRFRDTATKALVRLLDHRTRLLADLINAFSEVDDPYVTERLLAVACGHVIRHRAAPASDTFLTDLTDLGRARQPTGPHPEGAR